MSELVPVPPSEPKSILKRKFEKRRTRRLEDGEALGEGLALAWLWRLSFLVGTAIYPTLCLLFFAYNNDGTTQSIYLAISHVFGVFSFTCFSLLWLSNPRNKGALKYLLAMSTIFWSLTIAVKVVTESVLSIFLWSLIGCVATVFPVHMRRQYSRMADSKLRNFLYQGVLLNGFPSLASLLYLGLETKKCVEEAQDDPLWITDYEQNYMLACERMIVCQKIISYVLYLLLLMRLLAPLNRSSLATLSVTDVIELKVKGRDKFFLLMLMICGAGSLYIFAERDVGRVSTSLVIAAVITFLVTVLAVFEKTIDIVLRTPTSQKWARKASWRKFLFERMCCIRVKGEEENDDNDDIERGGTITSQVSSEVESAASKIASFV